MTCKSLILGIFNRAATTRVLGLVVLAVACPLAADQRLIEGFEDISRVSVSAGKLTVAQGGEGVTEGKQAAQVPNGATINLSLDGADCRTLPWLKMDTLTLQPLSQPVRLQLGAGNAALTFVAYVQPGKDTVALPLSAVANPPAGAGKVALSISNVGEAPLILDNIRLEAAAKPPPFTVLASFGPEGHPSWPGFESLGVKSKLLSWNALEAVYALNPGWPDPLGGQFIGRSPAAKAGGMFTVTPPWTTPGVAWFWVTHYGWTGLTQPMEYGLKAGGKPLVQKRLTARQMLGPEGLLEGMDGEWTPKWFDTVYARHFVEVVEAPLTPGGTRVELINCQVAAAAMAPADAKAALAEYVEQVQKDLWRYRRQFVAADRVENVCQLPPTEEEARAGLMVFQPPPDEAFATGWVPAEKDRLATLKVLTCNAGRAVAPLAVAPLKAAAGQLSGAVLPLRSADGRVLPTRKEGAVVWQVRNVPRLRDGRIEFQPWILSRERGPVKEREILHMALVIDVSPSAAAGVYRGMLRLSLAGVQHQLPLEVEVVDVGPAAQTAPTVATMDPVSIDLYYNALAEALPEPQRAQLTGKIRQLLLENCLSSHGIAGPTFGAGKEVVDKPFFQALREQAMSFHGLVLIDMTPAFLMLEGLAVQPNTQPYQRALNSLVARINELVSDTKLRGQCLLLVGAGNTEAFSATLSERAAALAAAGGKPVVWVHGALIAAMEKDKLSGFLRPLSGLIVTPTASMPEERMETLRKFGEGKAVLYYVCPPDRFTVGFRLSALEAEGCVLSGTFMTGGPYRGFNLDGSGLLAIEPDGGFSYTLTALRLWQGIDDHILARRAKALLAKAESAKVPALELDAALKEIRQAVAQAGVGYDPVCMRSSTVTPKQLDTWRGVLIRAAGTVNKRLTKPAAPTR